MYAGAGYGGSCFPKDVQALMATGRKHDVPMGIVTAAEEANARQKLRLPPKSRPTSARARRAKRSPLWGLAFKPNTDDMREAPSLVVVEQLLEAGPVRAFDPVATESARKILGARVQYCSGAYEALEGSDALVIVTEWNEFRNPDSAGIKSFSSSR